MNKNLVKWVIIFGGGLLGFALLKPKKKDLSIAKGAEEASSIASFDNEPSTTNINKEDAEIVYKAYAAAMSAGEPTSALTELNKECMKDYSMRCYMDKDGKYIVCDASGNIILTK